MSRLGRRLAILYGTAAFCACAANQDAWLRIRSANFEIYTTAGERSGRGLARHFEQARSFFVQAFGSGFPDAKPVKIIAFRNEKEFEPYRPNEFATAFFQPGEMYDFIVMSSGSAEHYQVATHEFTHLMVHQGGAHYPVWLNEGVADLFSNLQPLGNKIKVGQDIPGRLHTLRTEKWIPLGTLLAVDRNSSYYNERSKAGMFYAESWELVHMLFLHPDYSPALKTMSAALKDGDAASAFQRAYHKTIPEIEADLQGYLHGDKIKVFLFNIQLPKTVESPDIEKASNLLARLALAELLTDTRGHVDQARTAYESLAKDYPSTWEVEQGWGQWCWRQRRFEEAAGHYARAVSLGGTDPGLYLAYGHMLNLSNRLTDAIEVLGKAIQSHPESDELHFELGSIYVRSGNYGAALGEMRAMKNVQAPQAYRYFYNQAFAEYRLGRTAEAKAHAAKARTYTHNPEELASLARLEHALESK
jgi:tetratricopeptide (TPR) repeat protein